jgi:hypothetical protein
MNTVKKTIAVLLVLLLTVSLAACGSGTSWVYESDGRQIPAGLYLNYLTTALSDLELADLDAHADDPDYAVTDIKAFLKITNEEGVTISDQAKNGAAKKVAVYFAAEKLFEEMNLSLDDESLDAIDNYVEYTWENSGEQLEASGIGMESYRLYQINLLKQDTIFNALYGKGGERAVPEEDLKAAFLEQYARVELMYISVPETDGVEDATEKAKVEDYLARYKAGEAIEDLDYEYQLSIADEETKDTITKEETGAMIHILQVSAAEEGDVLMPAIIAANTGEVLMVEDNDIYYIFKKLDLTEKPEDYDAYRENIFYNMKAEEFEAYLDELADGVTLTANQAALNRYTPEKIKVQEAAA